MQRLTMLVLISCSMLTACKSNLNPTPTSQYNGQTPTTIDVREAPQQPIGPPASTKSSSSAQYVF